MKRSVGFLFLWTFLAVMSTIAADKPRVFVVASETVDASNSRDKAKHVDFGTALSAALTKKGCSSHGRHGRGQIPMDD